MSGREARAGKRAAHLTDILENDEFTHDKKLKESIDFFEKIRVESKKEGIDVDHIVREARKMLEDQIKNGEVRDNLKPLLGFLALIEEQPFRS